MFTELKLGYTLSYDSNGGINGPDKVVQYDNNIFTISNVQPTREGYKFISWNTQKDGTGTTYNEGESITISANEMLYAIWEEVTYTLTYDANGGVGGPSSVIQNTGTFDISDTRPTKEGYNFIEWNTKQDGTGIAYNAGESITITVNTILYARWKVAEDLIAWYDGINNTSGGHDYNTETWTDLTGNNTEGATINGATWTPNGICFDGSNDWVNMNSILMPESDNFTLEIVFSLNKNESQQCIVAQNSTLNGSGRFTLEYSDSESQLRTFYNKGETIYTNTEYKPELQEKVTATIVRDGNIQIWINGEKLGEQDGTGVKIYQENTILGKWGLSNNYYFNGIIYSVKAYGNVLDEEQIKENHTSNIERFKNDSLEYEQYSDYVTSNLTAWYDGFKNTSTGHDYTVETWTDLTGNNTEGATLNGNVWRYNGLAFNGSDDWVDMNSILMPQDDDFTLEVVLSLNEYKDKSIILAQNTTGTPKYRMALKYSDSVSQIRIFYNDGSTIYTSTKYKPELQEKVTVTILKKGNIQIWLNGVKIEERSETGEKIYQTNTILGKWGATDKYYFNGTIYSIRKYDRALSSTELLQNYNVDKLRFDM